MVVSFLPGTPPPLVGRERELRVLRERRTAADAGRGGLVLIGGEAGIGKTALAESLCREAAEQGTRVLVGRCYDLTETPPYGPWVELFGRYQPDDGTPPLPDTFARHGTVGEVTSQAALFQQALDFFAALAARRPLIVLLDDAHWMDAASLDLLRFVARSLAPHALLLLVTYRSDELTRRHPLSQLLPLLVRESSATRLALHALEPEDTAALVQARYALPDVDATRLVAYLDERAEGNPFFVGELLQTLEEEGVLRQRDEGWVLGGLSGVQVPPLLRQVIDGRLSRLGDEAQSLLAIAAVIGQVVPLAVWGKVAESDEETLLAVTERAIEAHLASATGETMHFLHALIREALYEGIVSPRRRGLHRRVGDALAALPNPDPDAVAYHFQQAGDSRALAWLITAGERAQAAFAWPTAVARYQAALAHEEGIDDNERGWLLYRIALLLRQTDPNRGIHYAQDAEAIAQTTSARALIAAARVQQGFDLWLTGHAATGAPIMWSVIPLLDALSTEEIAQIDRQDPTATVTDIRGFMIQLMVTFGRFAEALAATAQAPVVDPPPGVPTVRLSDEPWRAIVSNGYVGLAALHDSMGRYAEAREALTRAYLLADARLHTIDAWSGRLYLVSVMLRYAADRHEEVRSLVDEAEAVSERAVGTVMDDRRGMARALLDAVEGRWDVAERILDNMTTGRAGQWVGAMEIYGHLKRARGSGEVAWARVRQMLPEGETTAPGTQPLRIACEALHLGGALLLDAGDVERAKAWLEALDRWLEWSDTVRGQSERHGLWAQYYRQAGNSAHARAHAERALAHATEPRQPLALIAAHRLLGELDTNAGRFEDATRHLDESLRLADACAAPYERALTLLALAEFHTATSHHTEVIAFLDEVRAICTLLGAKPALARAHALAVRISSFPITLPAYPDGLSTREVEVLRLIATGQNNQEIADALSLSVRTVERHITNLYGKIGARGRADATAYALHHLT